MIFLNKSYDYFNLKYKKITILNKSYDIFK